MILFALQDFDPQGEALRTLAFLKPGRLTASRYSNRELYVKVLTSVSGEHCCVLGSITPPDDRLLTLLLVSDTLRRAGANEITALLPYLAYSRQDKDIPGESMATAWIGSLFKTSCINEVITIDVHSERDKKLFPRLVSLSTAPIFADAIRKCQLTEATIVAPDNGAISRCEEVKRAAGMAAGDIPYFEKKRRQGGLKHIGPFGNVGPRVVMVDDMLDTGGTLVSACEKLIDTQVQEIYIMVTHGIFTGEQWKRLWSLRVKQIFCTDTVPLRSDVDTRHITVLSVLPLLREGLLSLQNEKSRVMASNSD